MREHKDAAEKTRYSGNISAFSAHPWLAIDFNCLILVKTAKLII